ncbi:ATP-dependent DNA helicase CHL1-like [Prunus dulcis]|nr:ATP-dependent DNA helicase CHL1-like [Prunus dulcis]
MEMEATISKRRKGSFREATDLDSSSSSGFKMAVIVFSPANKPYVYGHPSAVSVLYRFLGEQDDDEDDDDDNDDEDDEDDDDDEDDEDDEDDDGVVIDEDLEANEEKAVQDGIDKYGLNEHAGVDEVDKKIATLKHFIKILDLKIDHEMKRKDSLHQG